MRRIAIVVLMGGGLVAACSSDAAEDEPVCRIEGTYTATGTKESGDCELAASGPVTDTITKLPDGRYRLEIQGATGACDLDLVETCKLQGKCQLAISDATNPDDVGTVQYSWTFHNMGFNGFSAVAIPPAASVPKGCTATARVEGTRR